MMKLTDKELLMVTGGAITATFINSIARGITTIADLGRSLGSAIRRIVSHKICPID